MTDERRAELRRIAEAVQKYRGNNRSWQGVEAFKDEGWVQEFAEYFAAIDADSLIALLDAADRVAALEDENATFSSRLADFMALAE